MSHSRPNEARSRKRSLIRETIRLKFWTNIFKLGIVINKLYACFGLNNNPKGVTLNWLDNPKDKFPYPSGKLIKGLPLVE